MGKRLDLIKIAEELQELPLFVRGYWHTSISERFLARSAFDDFNSDLKGARDIYCFMQPHCALDQMQPKM